MQEFYLFAVILLFVLAISDLVVGVSNDAVNFLNSAIGSKVTSRRNIMIVASLGILVGATFSSGMMEVARKGVFNPEYFYFSEIMVVFLAVMITDIILLDLFNTFGMPTSTTVSIVFELLGAAVAVSILKISHDGESLSMLGDYINTSSALIIISGIFLSVFIAFVIGAIVQYLSRLLFTFNVAKNMSWGSIAWSGLALTALTYFLLIKGLKGSSFVPTDVVAMVQEQTLMALGLSFVFWTLVMFVLNKIIKVNVLKIVVLFGTFALAMAFSGNDLVNFIGVPIAGFESFLAWSDSGQAADAYSMSILLAPVQTETYLLLTAGVIMIVTLWFSKKARSVTETEVNLGRQSAGDERFKPNLLSRKIVRYSLFFGNRMNNMLPDSWQAKAEARFQLQDDSEKNNEHDKPAFDLVRASVNLTVASVLIAFATSQKLPLSTTYVSFMVAMGTSLTDKAWGRSSAVFRIAGVLNVIGGWFATALLAFTAAATFATCIYFFDIAAIIVALLLVVFLVSRTFILHKKKEKVKKSRAEFQQQTASISFLDSISETTSGIIKTLKITRNIYSDALTGLLKENQKLLDSSKKKIKKLKLRQEEIKGQLYELIKRLDDQPTESGKLFLKAYDHEQDIMQSISLISDSCSEHVANSLPPVLNSNRDIIVNIMNDVNTYFEHLIELISNRRFEDLEPLLDEKKKLHLLIEEAMNAQIAGIRKGTVEKRNSLVLFTILLESKDLVAAAARFAKLYNRI